MLIRRTLLVATMVFMLWAAPAHAQTYGRTAGENQAQTGIVLAGQGAGEEAGASSLARTGQDNIVSLVQLSMVLLGVGAMSVFVARRRRQQTT